jgi:hypothetical protein
LASLPVRDALRVVRDCSEPDAAPFRVRFRLVAASSSQYGSHNLVELLRGDGYELGRNLSISDRGGRP